MRRLFGALPILFLMIGSTPSEILGQDPASDSTTDILLSVSGEVPHPLKLTAAGFARLPRQSVKARDHAGKESVFEGVMLVEILKQAGVPFGADLKGPALAQYLVVEAADGYRAVFALPELDPASTDAVDPPGRPPRRQAARRTRRPAPGHRPRREAPFARVRQVISLKVGRSVGKKWGTSRKRATQRGFIQVQQSRYHLALSY